MVNLLANNYKIPFKWSCVSGNLMTFILPLILLLAPFWSQPTEEEKHSCEMLH